MRTQISLITPAAASSTCPPAAATTPPYNRTFHAEPVYCFLIEIQPEPRTLGNQQFAIFKDEWLGIKDRHHWRDPVIGKLWRGEDADLLIH